MPVGGSARLLASLTQREHEVLGLLSQGHPDKEIAENLAVRYNADNIFDYIELTSEYSIFEIPVVSSWVGKKVMDVDVRRKHKINIIAVKNDNELNLNLGGDYVFDENDHLVVLGKSSDVFSVASDVKRPSR